MVILQPQLPTDYVAALVRYGTRGLVRGLLASVGMRVVGVVAEVQCLPTLVARELARFASCRVDGGVLFIAFVCEAFIGLNDV